MRAKRQNWLKGKTLATLKDLGRGEKKIFRRRFPFFEGRSGGRGREFPPETHVFSSPFASFGMTALKETDEEKGFYFND